MHTFPQCRSGLGVCPDVLDNRGTCTDNLLGVSGFSSNRQQCVSFTRPFTTGTYLHICMCIKQAI